MSDSHDHHISKHPICTQWSTGCERGTGADAVHTHTQRLQWEVNGAGRAAAAPVLLESEKRDRN
eukprot:1282488-Prymnesium_polylepis.1